MTLNREISLVEMGWHTLSLLVLIFVLPRMVAVSGFTGLAGINKWLILSIAAAYLITVASRYFSHGSALKRIGSSGLIGAALLAFIFLAMLLSPASDYSRKLLLSASALYVAGFGIPIIVRWPLRHIALAGAGTIGLIAVGAALVVFSRASTTRDEVSVERTTVAASKHTLRLSYYRNAITGRSGYSTRGGAVTPDPVGGGYFLVTGDGTIFNVQWTDTDDVVVDDLQISVPINSSDFRSDIEQTINPDNFRVADILARIEDSQTVLYATHHFWNTAQNCFVVRVSSTTLSDDVRAPGPPIASDWRTVFESAPCLPFAISRGAVFAGEQIGGNLESLADGSLLLTLGDHQFDGWYKDTDLVRNRDADYGKTLLLNVVTGDHRIFTIGHRNPQGLAVDSSGRIWSTEHGPQGGDELNLLEESHDYGYPIHTFGTEYGSSIWPPLERHGRLPDFTMPAFSWIPSIGISDLVEVTDPSFIRWQNDLLISSLTARQLWRVGLNGSRVVYAEPIEIGERIRDIASGPGEFVLWTDSNSIVRIEPLETLDDAAALFAVRCGGCHDDSQNRIGPTLNGFLDRPIATSKGYKYSAALQNMTGQWTYETLDAFIANPSEVVPGNKMAFSGIEDSEVRRKIIEYLKVSGG